MLRNIKFKKVTADIRGIYKISRILLRWELEHTNQNLKNLVFNVFRGESPSELKQINPLPLPAAGRNEYIDYTALLKDVTKTYYYQLQANELNCGRIIQTFSSDIIELEDTPDLMSLYILEEHLFAHQYVYGVPALIYTKKTEGPRCECWDEVLKRVIKSNCSKCKGTGFIGGYYPPVSVWMDFSPPPKQVAIADWGERQVKQTDIQFTDYPTLQIGDIILQCKPFNFWRVDMTHYTEKNQVTILQMARVSAVNRSDIEYTIEVPLGEVDRMIAELRERIQTPEF